MPTLGQVPRSLALVFETYVKRRNTFRYWQELERSQWLSRKELYQVQLTALRNLLVHASDYCPYYRDKWRELGLRPDRVASTTDLGQWPIITRETIRQNRQTMRSTASGIRLIRKATGGSSGIPLEFDIATDSNERRMAASHRGYAWAGAEPGTKQLYLWGVPLGGRPVWRRWKDFAYNRLVYRHYILNTFELSEQRVPQFLDAHNRYRPDVVVAYTNPLYEFARALREKGLKPFSPKSIVVGAEKLHDFQRAMIEEVFQSPVFETYGSREFMLIGAECDRHKGLHLTMESLLAEVVDDDGKPTPAGQEGNIAITDLYNYGMPFIRYMNGDRAVAGWSECTCGRGLPLLTKVTGRRLDILTAPDGRRIPGEFFPHLIKDYPSIERFQVMQEQFDSIVLRVVGNGKWNEATGRRITEEVRKIAGDSIHFTIQQVDSIPLTRSGKLQVVVNKCTQGEGQLAGCPQS